MGHFVVLYAFYDKDASPPRPSGKADEDDTYAGEAREYEEPLKIIIRSFHVMEELKEVTGVAFPYQECM